MRDGKDTENIAKSLFRRKAGEVKRTYLYEHIPPDTWREVACSVVPAVEPFVVSVLENEDWTAITSGGLLWREEERIHQLPFCTIRSLGSDFWGELSSGRTDKRNFEVLLLRDSSGRIFRIRVEAGSARIGFQYVLRLFLSGEINDDSEGAACDGDR